MRERKKKSGHKNVKLHAEGHAVSAFSSRLKFAWFDRKFSQQQLNGTEERAGFVGRQYRHRCASTSVSIFDICVAYVANAIASHKILILKIIVKNKRERK